MRALLALIALAGVVLALSLFVLRPMLSRQPAPQIAELTGIARPTAGRALHSLAQAGLVRWEGTSDRDPRASWHLL